MKKKHEFSVKRWSVAFAFGLAILPGLARADQPPGDAVDFTIFHTNDLHSHMKPPRADEFKLGGIARLATLLYDLRKTRAHSITLDAGDWSEGSWPYSVDTGASMLRILDKMGFDTVVVGNHDYLAGPDRLVETVKEASPRFHVLASNLDFTFYPRAGDFRKTIESTAVLEAGGVKIGVIGLTTVDATYASFLQPVFATDPVQEARAKVAALRPLVDVVVVLSHNTFETNVEIAREVPGIDVVVSGHSHKKVSHAVTVQSGGHTVPIVETGKWGTFLGDLRFRFHRDTRALEFLGYELHPVLPTLEPDAEIASMVAADYERLARIFGGDIGRVVAGSEVELDDVDSHHASLGDLATKAYRDATNADAGLELMPLVGVKTAAGPLSVEDLHDVMPHILNFKTGREWTLKVLTLKGLDLATIMTLFYWAGGPFPYAATGIVAADGIEAVWAPAEGAGGSPIPKIVALSVDGRPLDLGRSYKIAITDGMLGAILAVNGKLQLGMDLSKLQDTGIEGWRAVLAYGAKVKHFAADALRAGGISRSTLPDPAVFDYGISLRDGAIEVKVSNEGLAASDGARLECSTEAVNDVVDFDTDSAILTPVGDAPIPRLESGQSAVVSVPWKPSRPGYWPIDCKIAAGADAYAGNSAARRVFDVPAAD